jgi:hypothetical protein
MLRIHSNDAVHCQASSTITHPRQHRLLKSPAPPSPTYEGLQELRRDGSGARLMWVREQQAVV